MARGRRKKIATIEAITVVDRKPKKAWSTVNRTGDMNLRIVGSISAIFAGLSPEIDHFADICHLLPAGNEVVATEYYAAIKRALSDAP